MAGGGGGGHGGHGAAAHGGDHDEEEHEEHVNHEAWVIPYADMLTLLMGLFLVLYGMSSLDLRKFEAMAQGLGEALGSSDAAVQPFDAAGGTQPQIIDDVAPVEPRAGGDIAPDLGDTRAARAEAALAREEEAAQARLAEQATFTDVREQIATRAAQAGLGDALGFRTEARGLVVTILSDQVLFAAGSADVQAEGEEILALVAEAVQAVPNRIQVEGHTDDRPIRTASYPSNWELSTARATTVLQDLVATGLIPPDRIAAAGYADTRPVADNATPEGRARNRRVELVVLSQAAMEAEAPETVPETEVHLEPVVPEAAAQEPAEGHAEAELHEAPAEEHAEEPPHAEEAPAAEGH